MLTPEATTWCERTRAGIVKMLGPPGPPVAQMETRMTTLLGPPDVPDEPDVPDVPASVVDGRVPSVPGSQLDVHNFTSRDLLRKVKREYRGVMLQAIGEEDFDAVVRTLLVAAKCGDLTAIKLVVEQLVGKAHQSVEVTTADPQELAFQVRNMLKTVPPGEDTR